MAKIPVKDSSKKDSNQDILSSLHSINQDLMDSADVNRQLNSTLKEVAETLKLQNAGTNKSENLSGVTKSIDENTKALNTVLRNMSSVFNAYKNSSKGAGDELDLALKREKLAKEKARAEEVAERNKRNAEMDQKRKEQFDWNFARSQELAKRQDEDYAKRQAEQAEAQIKKERETAAQNSPLAKMGSSISQAQGGFFPSTFLSMATGGVINPAIANMLGLDKVFSAGIGAVKNKINSTLGQRAQKKQAEKDQLEADQRAMDNAIHAAELNKKIDEALEAKGLKKPSEGEEGVGNEKGKVKGGPAYEGAQFVNATFINSSGEENKKDKGEGKTSSATKENPNKGLEERLDKMNTNLKEMSKPKPKPEQKKEDNLFEKIFGFIGSAIGGLANMAMSALSGLGSIILGAVTAAAPILAGALATAVAAAIAAWAAGKAVEHVDENTNLLGGGSVRAQNKSTEFINRKDIKEYNDKAGAYAGFAQMDTWINTNAAVTESGKLWGKNQEAIDQHRRMRANSAKDALKYDGKQKIVDKIESDVENGKMSREEADELLIKHAREGVAANRKTNQGRDIEEVRAENKARVESYKMAENEARNQTYNLFTGQGRDMNVENPEEQMMSIQDTMSDVVSEEDSKILIKTDTINMNNGGAQMSMGSMSSSSKSPALPSDSHYSEDTMNHMNSNANNAAQTQKLTNSISNNTTNNNGSNIVQTNITQHNETGVYATGDAARTMLMN